MIGMTVLRAADRRPQPWKNGGGVTSEVIAYPLGCGTHDFDWRVSIAEVTEAGPFSCFEGVDRVLAVLEGELELDIGTGAPIALTRESIPHAFPADVSTYGKPLGCVVKDLNVMCWRGLWSADVFRVHVEANRRVIQKLAGTALILATGNLTVVGPTSSHNLARYDAVFTCGIENVQLLSQDSTRVIFINLHTT
jgi:environmental stress-induced protein Ves